MFIFPAECSKIRLMKLNNAVMIPDKKMNCVTCWKCHFPMTPHVRNVKGKFHISAPMSKPVHEPCPAIRFARIIPTSLFANPSESYFLTNNRRLFEIRTQT